MNYVEIGFDVVAAQSKRRDDEDQPEKETMRGSRKIMSNPSTDQKRQRRQQSRSERQIGAGMTFHTEAALLQAISSAPTLAEQGRLVGELQALRQASAAKIQQDRDVEWADTVITQTLAPASTHIFHTAATDWLDDVSATPADNAHQEMMAEAAAWWHRTSAFVKSDKEELAEQAMGQARFLAGKYGEAAPAAARSFLDYVAFLHSREAASGLDQIQQTIDPNNSPKTTPLPDGTFDNFAPPVNEFNNGVDEAQSSWNSETVNDMINGSGGADLSGGGSGTAGGTMSPGGGKPSEHDTGNNGSEVPAASIGGQGEFSGGTPLPKQGSLEDADVAPFGLTSLAMQYVANLDDFTSIFAAEAQAKTAAFKECALCAKGSCGDCKSCPGRGSCHMTSGDVEHGSGTEGGHGQFAAHGIKGEVVSRWGRNPKLAAKCSNCTNGNHTGTNGSEDTKCKGGSCNCNCRKQGSKEAASTLDQIQQTTAPDGVTNKPTPLPGEVMFTLTPEFEEEPSTGAPGAPDNPSQEHSTTNAAKRNKTCPDCKGSGKANRDIDPGVAVHDKAEYKCTNCNGKGYNAVEHESAKKTADFGDTSSGFGQPGGGSGGGSTCPGTGANAQSVGNGQAECGHCGQTTRAQSGMGGNTIAAPHFSVKKTAKHKTDDRGVEYVENGDLDNLPDGWAQCGHCKRAWNDDKSTSVTPAPSARCPFEYEHKYAVRKSADMFGNSDEPHKVPGSQRDGYNQEHNVGPKAGEAEDGGEKDVPGSMTQDFDNDNTHDFNVKASADYQKAFKFAQKWTPDMRLVTTGSAEFETGIFEGLTETNRAAFLAKHVEQAKDYPVLAERILAHASLAAHLAGTDTDLATTAPGSYPDQGGKTPINGPGTTPVLEGGMDPAAAGGPAPYNGTDPLGHGVVPGVDQKPKAPHPNEFQPPARMDHGVDLTGMTPQTLAFRQKVQATLLKESKFDEQGAWQSDMDHHFLGVDGCDECLRCGAHYCTADGDRPEVRCTGRTDLVHPINGEASSHSLDNCPEYDATANCDHLATNHGCDCSHCKS